MSVVRAGDEDRRREREREREWSQTNDAAFHGRNDTMEKRP